MLNTHYRIVLYNATLILSCSWLLYWNDFVYRISRRIVTFMIIAPYKYSYLLTYLSVNL